MQEIIIHTISISKKGQIRFFEIPLPRNTAFITGIDYRFRMLDDTSINIIPKGEPTPFKPEPIIGILSLSSSQREGIFFFGNLILESVNAGMLDYSAAFFPATSYNRDPMPTPLQVKIDGKTTNVNGFFKDSWGAFKNQNVEYEVSIYLHLEIKNHD